MPSEPTADHGKPLDQEQFQYLFINTNSLAELALIQFAEELALLPEPAPAPILSDEDIEARLTAQFETMDLSALDGIDFDFFSTPARTTEAAAPDSDQIPKDSAAAEQDPVDSGPLDIARYLDRAYASASMIETRIGQARAKCDHVAILALLARLPSAPMPLTQRLTPESMAAWLLRYRSDDAALSELVTRMRALSLGI